jgi:hypothetical protein
MGMVECHAPRPPRSLGAIRLFLFDIDGVLAGKTSRAMLAASAVEPDLVLENVDELVSLLAEQDARS